MSDTLYRSLVVERARRPLYAGSVEPADAEADGTNPLCGDKTHITLRRNGEIRHQTRGCAICTASADLMAETASGLAPDQVRALWIRFNALLQHGPSDDDLGVLNAFADLHEYRSRRKCATLPWTALLSALETP